MISGDNVEVGAFVFAGVVGPENFFRSQSAGGDPFRESYFQPARCAPFGTVTDAKRIVFQQGNKAAAKTKKIGGAHHEGLQELVKISTGAEFGRDFEQLVKLVGLGVSGGVQLGMSHGHGSETGDGRHQSFFLRRETTLCPGIDQDCSLRPRSAEGRGDQHARRNQVAERVHVGADGKSDGLPGADGTLSQIGGEANGLPVVPGANGVGKLRTFRGNGAQFKRPLAAQQNAH